MKSKVSDIFSQVEIYKLTHDRMLELFGELYSLPDWKKMPSNNRAYMRGVINTKSNTLWHTQLDWRLGPASGPLPKSEHHWKEGSQLSTLCRIPGALYGGHYWKDTDKVFTEYKPIN